LQRLKSADARRPAPEKEKPASGGAGGMGGTNY